MISAKDTEMIYLNLRLETWSKNTLKLSRVRRYLRYMTHDGTRCHKVRSILLAVNDAEMQPRPANLADHIYPCVNRTNSSFVMKFPIENLQAKSGIRVYKLMYSTRCMMSFVPSIVGSRKGLQQTTIHQWRSV